MMTTYTPQLQHAVSQAPQQGHPGQPTPHAMQHLHPTQAFQHQQQMQAMANSMNIPYNQRLIQQRQQQQMLMSGLQANGLSAAGSPGIASENQQIARAFMPNGTFIGVGGNPQNQAMGAFAGAPPHMRGPMIPQHLQQLASAQQAQMQQQQHMHQLALANQGVNVQAGQNMSMPQQQVNIPANAAAAAAARSQQQKQSAGQAVLKMHLFNHVLSTYVRDNTPNSMNYWRKFVGDYFSPTGTMRQNLWNNNRNESKQFEIGNPILARYFWELIESGVNSIQFMLEGMREKELPNGQGMVVECVKAGIIYTYKDAMCIHHGTLRATLNAALQVDLLEFSVTEHQEFVSRSSLQPLSNPNDSPDVKASPRSKSLGKQAMQQPQTIAMPESCVNHYGMSSMVIRFLETAETLSCMSDLMMFSRSNPTLTPRDALTALVAQLTQQMQQQQIQQQQMQQQQMQQAAAAAAANAQGMQNSQQGHPGAPNAGAGPQMHHSPHMSMVPGMTGSPAAGEGRLVPPSPHIGQTPSPASNQLQAPGQQPQQHPISNPSSQNSTTVGSADTSPNQPNKRRRPSSSQNVKNEPEDGNEAVNIPKMPVKPSPRIGGHKRVKANPS